MQSVDLSQGWSDAQSQIEAIKEYNNVSSGTKELKKSAGNAFEKSAGFLSTQLDKITEQQKRYLRNPQTSMDHLLNLFGSTSGQGENSFKYLRKKFLEVSVKVGPKIEEILNEQTLKALGCSQEQEYNAVSPDVLQVQPLSTLPISIGTYIPVQSLDLNNILKNPITSPLGKVFYEKETPSSSTIFKPYGGNVSFPMNKALNQIMNQKNSSFKQIYGNFYNGQSQQNLFDIEYTTTNNFGISGNYLRIVLLDRENQKNKVSQFFKDYYKTIKIVDSVDISTQLLNLLTNAISMKASLGVGEISNQNKFSLILTRILGLCFDSRSEIDVSGVSKVAELDGVDDSFYEFTESDLRNLDTIITNVQNNLVQYEDCGNISLPVDYETIVGQLEEFRATLSAQTPEQQVTTIEKIVDSISQNPDWTIRVPTNLNVNVSINKNLIKQIPVAVASAVLSPKVLLPIYAMLSVVESGATNTYNKVVTSANTIIQSGNTTGGQINNLVGNGVDFAIKFKQFTIQVVSLIGQLYLVTLFNVLKKDIINLLSTIISDIGKEKVQKKVAMILRLVGIAYTVAQLIRDYRKCKSLLNDILALLKLISGTIPGVGSIPGFGGAAGFGGFNEIPAPLLLLSGALPGTSSVRTSINHIQGLQALGIPTGPLPDGTPNMMNISFLTSFQAQQKENSENGKTEVALTLPPPFGLITGIGKSF